MNLSNSMKHSETNGINIIMDSGMPTKKLNFYSEPFIRFEDRPEEHRTFFLIDPSNNLLEFKYYKKQEMMY